MFLQYSVLYGLNFFCKKFYSIAQGKYICLRGLQTQDSKLYILYVRGLSNENAVFSMSLEDTST